MTSMRFLYKKKETASQTKTDPLPQQNNDNDDPYEIWGQRLKAMKKGLRFLRTYEQESKLDEAEVDRCMIFLKKYHTACNQAKTFIDALEKERKEHPKTFTVREHLAMTRWGIYTENYCGIFESKKSAIAQINTTFSTKIAETFPEPPKLKK